MVASVQPKQKHEGTGAEPTSTGQKGILRNGKAVEEQPTTTGEGKWRVSEE